jgi:hypothetical protein
MRAKYCLASAAIMFVCFVAPASASVIEYTNMAAFEAAVSGATTYGFEGIAPVGSFAVTTPAVGGVLFTADAYPATFRSSSTPIPKAMGLPSSPVRQPTPLSHPTWWRPCRLA